MMTQRLIAQRFLTLAVLLTTSHVSFAMRCATNIAHRPPLAAGMRKIIPTAARLAFPLPLRRRTLDKSMLPTQASALSSVKVLSEHDRKMHHPITPEQEQKLREELWNSFMKHPNDHAACTEAVRIALDAGMSPNAPLSANNIPLLHFAIGSRNQNMTRLVIDRNANIQLKDPIGFTALHIASACRNVAIVPELLALKADVHAKGKRGETPIDLAVWSTDPEIVRLLCEAKADLSVATFNQRPPLHGAIQRITELQHAEQTPEQQEALAKHLAVVKALLEAKAPINAQDGNGDTPLHLAAKSKSPELVQLLLEYGPDMTIKNNGLFIPVFGALKDTNCLRILLDYVDVNATCYDEVPLLSAVAAIGDGESIQALVDKKANVNIRDNRGGTPLHYAVDRDNFGTTEVLIANKADVDANTLKGLSPLKVALRPSKAARMLLDAGATPPDVSWFVSNKNAEETTDAQQE